MLKNTKLDLSYLKTMSTGDPQTMQTLLEALLHELKTDLPRARKLYEAKDWVELGRFCHHFKSTVSFSGEERLINANLALLEIAEEAPSVDNKGERIISQMEKMGAAVAQEIKRII